MVIRVLLFFLSLHLGFENFIHSQSVAVPQGTFVSPVDFQFKLSGGFSELRETHFHAGIDIKPSIKGKKDKIYSIAHGYVSRIKISTGGYGYAVYIDHPEIGYTSVYGHLESFSQKIDEIARQFQNKNQSFEIDLPLSKDILPVSKGEVIGIMGNTGYSFGEHLHFEVRDTKSEKPLNPFLFGFSAFDNIAPSMANLAIHGLDDYFHKLCDVRIPLSAAENGYINLANPIEIPATKVGFALQVYDRANGAHNKMGIYGLHVYADEKLLYSYHMDKISFDQSKQVMGFYDYGERKKSGQTFSLCYKLPGIDIDFLSKNDNSLLTLFSDRNTKIRIEAEDFHRNKKTLLFELKRAQNLIEKVNHGAFTQWIPVGHSAEIKESGAIVTFGINALYRSIPFLIQRKPNLTGNATYQIHHEKEALKSSIELMIKPDVNLPAFRDKAIITWTSEKGKKQNCGGTWQESYIRCRINEFGAYSVQYDTIAPTIKNILFRPQASNINKFKFEIKDEMEVKGRDAREVQYSVKIDRKNIISPYNLKSSVLEVPIQSISPGEHELIITAWDHSGNIREYKNKFYK